LGSPLRKAEHGAIAALVRRLADSREYFDDPSAVPETVEQLDDLLAHEGFRVRSIGGRGVVVSAAEAVLPDLDVPVELRTSVTALVADRVAAQSLQRRSLSCCTVSPIAEYMTPAL
jgi:hypothetical protein